MKLNNTQRKYIAHILDHLNHNKIASESYEGCGGWYRGNRDSFVKMHKETIEFVESMLKFVENRAAEKLILEKLDKAPKQD